MQGSGLKGFGFRVYLGVSGCRVSGFTQGFGLKSRSREATQLMWLHAAKGRVLRA